MRHYEQLFILKPTLTPEETATKIESIKESITANGGEIIAFDNIGSKKLAYPIDKNKRGHYGVLYFKIAPSSILELERLYRISEDVLKFMTVKYESKKEVKAFNEMVAKVVGDKKETVEENREEA
jgi:small subunit ribosomal protein S6